MDEQVENLLDRIYELECKVCDLQADLSEAYRDMSLSMQEEYRKGYDDGFAAGYDEAAAREDGRDGW